MRGANTRFGPTKPVGMDEIGAALFVGAILVIALVLE